MDKIEIQDSLYPKKLKIIPNPPQRIFVEGNINLLNSKSIAIVGSRKASKNGLILAEKFANELSKTGFTIISGLALGIDTVAHASSYKELGRTIAVIASGFNKIYPKENLILYNEILNNNGLIISEYAPNVEAQSDFFPKRNRLVSGLSDGVLVIEAQYRSGTSITVNHAIEQKKTIFAIPHEIWDKNGVGTNKLIKNGAVLVTDTEDILKQLYTRTEILDKYLDLKQNDEFHKYSKKNIKLVIEKSIKEDLKLSIEKSIKKSVERSLKKSIRDSIKLSMKNKNKNKIKKLKKQTSKTNIISNKEGNISSNTPNKNIILANISEQKIYDFLQNNTQNVPFTVNEIAQKTNFQINEVLSNLFILELNGYIKKVSGGYVCI